MRILLQRISTAAVHVDEALVGQAGPGLLALICAMDGDDAATVAKAVRKVVNLRIFADDAGKMNRSVLDVGGDILAVSQFTLAADVSSDNRPGFSSAAKPSEGEGLFEAVCAGLRETGLAVETGKFGANMQVSLTNDGPVTIWLDI
jgi:D-tyrosyl-tRNA(Tyr) deacylase